MGGGPWGVHGGGAYVANFFFEIFAFQNRAQGIGRVGRGDNFPPPLVRAGEVRQGQKFRIFWGDDFFFDPEKSKNVIFLKWTPKTYLKSFAPRLPLYDVLFHRFASYTYW